MFMISTNRTSKDENANEFYVISMYFIAKIMYNRVDKLLIYFIASW